MEKSEVISVGYAEGYKKASAELAKRLTDSVKRNKEDLRKVLDDVTTLSFEQAVNILEMALTLCDMKKSPMPFNDDVEDDFVDDEIDITDKYIHLKKENLIAATVMYKDTVLVITPESEEE